LAEAQNNVEIALDRMNDAEAYAQWIDELNDQMKKDFSKLQKQRKMASIGFSISFSGAAAGGTMMGLGIANQDPGLTIGGGGIILGSGAIWLVAHYMFGWW
jgi:hypothetical protein